MSRKQDLTQSSLQEFCNLYDELAEQFGFTKIKSNRPANVIAESILVSQFDEIANYTRT